MSIFLKSKCTNFIISSCGHKSVSKSIENRTIKFFIILTNVYFLNYFLDTFASNFVEMRIVPFLLFFVAFSFTAQAQFEASKRKINISAAPEKATKNKANTPESNSKPITPPVQFQSQLAKKNDDKFLKGLPQLPKVGENKTPKNEVFLNPAEDFTEKFNKQLKEDGIRPELFNRDINYGQFVVYTQTIKLDSRDYGVVDGDLVRIWVNGAMVTREIYLESKFKELILELNKGVNVIEIEALNYGDLSPNTGQFTFYDANKQFVTNQYWNLGIGFKARILIEYKDKILKSIDEK